MDNYCYIKPTKKQLHDIRDAQMHLSGWPPFLYFVDVWLTETNAHGVTVFAADAEQATKRVTEALELFQVEYIRLSEPHRPRTRWDKPRGYTEPPATGKKK